MSPEREPRLSPRMQRAVEELKGLVQHHYPEATFHVTRDPEERRSIDILTTVDVDDRQVVTDIVRERVLELQLHEHLPVHVIPLHTPERARALLEQQRHEQPSATDIPPDLVSSIRSQLEG